MALVIEIEHNLDGFEERIMHKLALDLAACNLREGFELVLNLSLCMKIHWKVHVCLSRPSRLEGCEA